MAAMDQAPSFGTDLITRHGSEALLRHNDEEIRLLESMRAYMAKRAKADQDYAKELLKLRADRSTGSHLHRTESNATEELNPIFKAWHMFQSETDRVSTLISQHSQSLNAITVQSLDKLLNSKKQAKKRFTTCRQDVDAAYGKTTERVTKLKKSYKALSMDVSKKKLDFQRCVGMPNAEEKKKKYINGAVKLCKCHNEYLLALQEVQEHQEAYRTRILPLLLNNMQQMCQGHAQQWMDAMTDSLDNIDCCREEYREIYSRLHATLEELDPQTEYNSFIERNGGKLPPAERFTFDEKLLDHGPENASSDHLVINNLTQPQLEEDLTKKQKKLDDFRKDLQNKTDELDVVRNTQVDENVSPAEQMEQHMNTLRKYSDLSLEVEQLWLEQTKLELAVTTVEASLSSLDGQAAPLFDEAVGQLDHQVLDSQDYTNGDAAGGALGIGGPKNRLSGFIGGVSFMTKKMKKFGKKAGLKSTKSSHSAVSGGAPSPTSPGMDMDDEFDPSDTEYDMPESHAGVEDEPWYHGEISRQEASGLLKKLGDFLVRYSAEKEHYTLSVKMDSIRHFIIQHNDEGFRFESDAFASIPLLIDHYVRNRLAVTQKSQATLKQPVKKPDLREYEIRHDNVVIGKKIGKGNFGDVFKGYLTTHNIEVAVKSCRSEDFPDKQKFLREAEILKQYRHPNIVELIGVCADKEPLYIIMELMPNGNFLEFLRSAEGKRLKVSQLSEMCVDAAAGMVFLEQRNCIHRDLAARNCLVGDGNIVKISDFGMSREEDDGIYTVSSGLKQIPIKWTSPEALNYGRYTTQSDVWSYGILLWETYTYGSGPYPSMQNRETREKIESGYRMPKPDLCPPAVYKLMLACWEYDPDSRPSFAEIYDRLYQISH
ncbi:tyrosine-protein kinase Fer-like [Sycon ciliatum]|uniref:tyrosine-protein kinase Fer-like n=1 Tax=Sycon ciliatum TaxID=27933 RepID=UPI0031F6E704